MKVLVVDDSSYVRVQMKWLLSKEGHEIAGENDYNRVMEKVEKERPDVVFFTLLANNEHSLAALKNLRAAYPALKTIVVAHHEQGVSREMVEGLGVAGFLTKPFMRSEVLRALHAPPSSPSLK